ncbi:hypothetical protein [Nocardia colli]|uniref:hypothetical protein n=1 Tax=Nocardia colli TaxID=2545717 RepID=UPI0035DFA1B9
MGTVELPVRRKLFDDSVLAEIRTWTRLSPERPGEKGRLMILNFFSMLVDFFRAVIGI